MEDHTTQGVTVGEKVHFQADGAKEPLQVRIPVPVKRRFKAYAALHGFELNELFVEVWKHYEHTFTAASGDQAQ